MIINPPPGKSGSTIFFSPNHGDLPAAGLDRTTPRRGQSFPLRQDRQRLLPAAPAHLRRRPQRSAYRRTLRRTEESTPVLPIQLHTRNSCRFPRRHPRNRRRYRRRNATGPATGTAARNLGHESPCTANASVKFSSSTIAHLGSFANGTSPQSSMAHLFSPLSCAILPEYGRSYRSIMSLAAARSRSFSRSRNRSGDVFPLPVRGGGILGG